MWIVANGALKSGSTWIYQLVNGLPGTRRLPGKFQEKGWANASVARKMVPEAADFLGQRHEVYVSKQHWARDNSWVMADPGIKVINIIRDIRDVMVSRYHHDVRVFGFDGGMEGFMQTRMEDMVAENVFYHAYWVNSRLTSAQSYHIASYEQLLGAYEDGVTQLIDFTGLTVPLATKHKIMEANLFTNKKQTGIGQFFRKGQAGGFADDLTPAQSQMILDQAGKLGFGGVKRQIAQFDPRLTPWLEQTDIGLG